MTAMDESRILAALRTLLDRVHLATPGQVPDVVSAAAAELGWTTTLYVVDYEQRHLVPVAAAAPTPERQNIDGTLAGRAFKLTLPLVAHGDAPCLWVPVVDGVHRLGVLRVVVPPGTDLAHPVVVEAYRLLGQLTGHLIAAKTPYGDALQRASRTQERTVASELLWDLLPPLTFGCDGLVISGILEPCYNVAADAFDYSVVDDVAHFAVLDATGHDLEGTVVAAVALAALRNSRREERDLVATVQAAHDVVVAQGHGERFVTGVVARLDLRTGVLQYVSAGHPSPLLMRRGRVVKELKGGRTTLLGFGGRPAVPAQESLEPGDGIVLYTDGITEARDSAGRFFGLDGLIGHLERSSAAGLHAPETLRRLTHSILDHQGGVLQDDATLVLAQWRTGEQHEYAPSQELSPSPLDDPDTRH